MKFAALFFLLAFTSFAQAADGFSIVRKEWIFTQISATEYIGEVAGFQVGDMSGDSGAFWGKLELISPYMIRLNLNGKVSTLAANVEALSDGTIGYLSVAPSSFASTNTANVRHGGFECGAIADKRSLRCYQTDYVRNGTLGE
jgi:hypothetical protein